MPAKKGDPQTKHLNPIRSTDDPRFKKLTEGRERYQAAQRERKRQRIEYTSQLNDIKKQQLEIATDAMESGDIPAPMKLLMDMIANQMVAVANPDLKPNEALKEKELLLNMQKQYTNMLSASAPSTQAISAPEVEQDEMLEEDFEKEFKKFTPKVVGEDD